MTESLKPVNLTVVDTTTAEWVPFPVPAINATLTAMPLVEDPETGVSVLKMIYRAGFTNPWHTHPCAHGIYVLEGTLRSHQGTHPAGTFVWFPEGGIMEHGATEDGDCTFLFITNKTFGIDHITP